MFDSRMEIRLSQAEKSALREAARERGLSQSEYLRALIRREDSFFGKKAE